MCRWLSVMLMAACLFEGCINRPAGIALGRRNFFASFTDFSRFLKASGAPGETILTSPEITVPVAWDEMVASWNTPPGVYLKIEARGVYPDHTTKYYALGLWSDDFSAHPRQSVNGQRDADGTVDTDTLVLARRGAKVQLRITLGSSDAKTVPPFKFLALSFCDSQAQAVPHEPNRAAWGRIIPVPEKRQSDYEGGNAWCSPASLSMVLDFWGETLHRPELDRSVPEVAQAVNDPSWGGTGNWPFNTAYAGEFPGLRACVARFDDISEVEDWIAAGIPVVLSVSSYLTNDRHDGEDNGHLIVCAGFTGTGDVVANDPGVSIKQGQRARRVYPRERVVAAWKKSKNAVYLIYPESARIPPNRFGHWEPGGKNDMTKPPNR